VGFNEETSAPEHLFFWRSVITDLFQDISACEKCRTGGIKLLVLICKRVFLHYLKI